MAVSEWFDPKSGIFPDTMELIDPRLPEIVHLFITWGPGNISDAVRRLNNENPLHLRPSERTDYELMIGRILLEAYIRTGFDPTDLCTLEMVRMPGKTKCCNPYSDNMYRHLLETTAYETDDGMIRFLFERSGQQLEHP